MSEEYDIKESSNAMSDEEIRAAAENIGSSPFTAESATQSEEAGNAENVNETTADNASDGVYSNAYGAYSGYNGNRYSSYTNYDYSGSSDMYDKKPERKKKKFFAKFGKLVAMAACFGLVAGGTFYGTTAGLDALLGGDSFLSETGATVEETTTNAIKQLGVSNLVIASTGTTAAKSESNSVVVDVVKENMPSTVCISISYTVTQRDIWYGRTSSYEATGGGTGFIVGMSDNEVFIATNNHVVEKAEKITITFSNDSEVEATVRATDPDNDLAIVSVQKSDLADETLAGLKVATLGNSDDSEVGEMVIAIGNALGYGQSVTVGYLSAKDRKVTYESKEMTLLQTDAAINGGNSGGPLFNVKGEVIGINCAKYSDESVEGMCFAIPISAAIPILDELINREILSEEEQGYLGVTITDVTDTLANLLGLPYGVRVQSVVEGGSAAKAGLYSGDIITAVNGVSVSTSDQLRTKVNSYRYGTTIKVTLQRLVEGTWTEMELDVELMKKPTN